MQKECPICSQNTETRDKIFLLLLFFLFVHNIPNVHTQQPPQEIKHAKKKYKMTQIQEGKRLTVTVLMETDNGTTTTDLKSVCLKYVQRTQRYQENNMYDKEY